MTRRGVVELNDLVEVAAEEVGLLVRCDLGLCVKLGHELTSYIIWPPIKLELKAQLNSRLAVGHDVGFARVGGVRVEVVEDKADQCGSVLVLGGVTWVVGVELRVEVGGAFHQGLDHVEDRVLVGDAVGAGDIVFLQGEVDLDAEAEVDGFIAA